jgi:hypothetical protein
VLRWDWGPGELGLQEGCAFFEDIVSWIAEIRTTLPSRPKRRQGKGAGALTARWAWLEVQPSARSSPHLNPKEHEWRRVKRDHCGHLAGFLRAFVNTTVAGRPQLGGEVSAIIDEVPPLRLEGHRMNQTGRPLGRPTDPPDPGPAQDERRAYLRILSHHADLRPTGIDGCRSWLSGSIHPIPAASLRLRSDHSDGGSTSSGRPKVVVQYQWKSEFAL